MSEVSSDDNRPADCPEFDLSFCDRYGYPSAIRSHWRAIAEAVAKELPAVESIVALGSTTRGELTYENDNSLWLLSDYELQAVTPSSPPADKQAALSERLRALKSDWDVGGPIFDIDVTVNSRAELFVKRFLDRTLFVYDAIATGHTVYGRDITAYLGSPSPARIDGRYLNQLVPTRLHNQLYLTPRKVASSDATAAERTVYRYTLARNCLEIATILTPQRGHFRPAFGERIDELERVDEGYLGGDEFIDHLSACLDTKQSLEFRLAPWKYHAGFLSGYASLTAWLLDDGPTQSVDALLPFLRRLRATSVSPFSRQPLPLKRRVAGQLRYVRAAVPESGWAAGLRWLLTDERLDAAALLLALHAWLFARLYPDRTTEVLGCDPARAQHALPEFVEATYDRIVLDGTITLDSGNPEEWLRARRKTATALARMSVGKDEASIRKTMTWEVPES